MRKAHNVQRVYIILKHVCICYTNLKIILVFSNQCRVRVCMCFSRLMWKKALVLWENNIPCDCGIEINFIWWRPTMPSSNQIRSIPHQLDTIFIRTHNKCIGSEIYFIQSKIESNFCIPKWIQFIWMSSRLNKWHGPLMATLESLISIWNEWWNSICFTRSIVANFELLYFMDLHPIRNRTKCV